MISDAGPNPVRIMALTALALTAFSANSILCRFALGGGLIDAAGFTSIRICSGALFLGIVLVLKKYRLKKIGNQKNRLMPIMLTLYALFFSYAYTRLDAGTGALILFGAVQATMILSAWLSGERMSRLQFTGFFMAISGLVYLVFPGLKAPSPLGACLMTLAGMAWGIYSLLGRKTPDPVSATAFNFMVSIPLVFIPGLCIPTPVFITAKGAAAAILSGTLASGAGYVIWATASRGLSSTQAAIVQLSVPVITALCGILFLSEMISSRFLMASFFILSGIGLAFLKK
jgi:drug/metabolite transporter (DMT)-like permease